MVSVNIEDEELWNGFIIQSRSIGKSASERITEFIKKEMKKGIDLNGNKGTEEHD